MWLAELFKNLGGFGSELSSFNLLVLGLLGWFAKRRLAGLKKKEARLDELYKEFEIQGSDSVKTERAERREQHKEMHEDFIHRMKQKASGAHRFEDREMLVGMVDAILKERE